MEVNEKRAEKIFEDSIKKLAFTTEGKNILKEIFTIHGHFEADELYRSLRQRSDRKISRATVYRILPLLEEGGLIRRVVFIDKHTHHENIYSHRHHEHLICIKCGKVIVLMKRRTFEVNVL